ncbi:PEP/pyruvate-binding domain-containing protein [Actinomadura verrucosospora]|uniref:Phosphoenolpyruvate synthase n=1 Tax=Actinomadura verrucosospora TaxID=46165 RepID=A0A7D3W5C1_ACTVE|nr:PEP/pyruvate-binding domain-containing protein [Actinomadura verrucosospora]QKG26812.1 phosphoenolpyruvate synthase [Actinomadura verrucosospora]
MSTSEVGHKFARLATLRDAGFPVPEFFCVPASEFDRALDGLSGALPPRSAVPAAQWCRFAASALAGAVPDGALAGRLLAGFDELTRGGAGMGAADGTVAVRACVVPGPDGAAEDSAGDPFAGLSDSFLYVRRDGLLEAVARCWASAFKTEAVRYREFRGIDPAAARVAVGVQRMVPGTRSFVAFTRDPRDGAHRHVIAAAHGIGEGVVQEKADVDHFFVDPGTGRVEAEVVTKDRMVGPPADGGEGPRTVRVPDELRTPPVLTGEQAGEVADLAARVEVLFGCPQDIEGTITPDGAVHLVQARPLAAAPEQEREPRVHWGDHNITESFPGVSGALTYSQARAFYQLAFTDLYRRMGVPARRLRARGHRLARMVGHLDGRVYYRLDDWQDLHGQVPVFDLVRSGWEEGMGITGEARAEHRWPRARVAAALPALAWRAAGHRRATVRFLRWWDALMADVRGPASRPLAEYTPDELITLYRWVWAEASVRWGVTLANGVYGLLLMRAATALLRRWAGAEPELLPGLLCGGPENRSLAAARAALALAERAAGVPALKAALLADDLGGRTDEEHLRAVWDDVAAGRHGAFLAASARAYLRRYGDRAVHDLKLDEPTPRQRPWMTAAVLRPLVRQGATAAANRAAEAREAAAARRRLRESCPGPAKRAVLRVLLGMMRWSVRAREDARFCRTQLFGLSREVMWRLGGELAAAGLLDAPLDVADLTVEEVIGAFDGTLPGCDLRGLAALRRAERVRNGAAPPPPALLSVPAARPAAAALPYARPLGEPDGAAADGTLRGLGSGGGTVRGRAKVVLDPRVPPGDCAGRILVARETDPGWLALMIAASGLVVERGTLLSHTAVTGRLLGVPTAVAVGGAVARIPDGAWIELDGRSGTIRILGAPAGAAG